MSAPTMREILLTFDFDRSQYLGDGECESECSFQGVDLKMRMIPNFLREDSPKPRLVVFLLAKCSEGVDADILFGLKSWNPPGPVYNFSGHKNFKSSNWTKISHDPSLVREISSINSSIVYSEDLQPGSKRYSNFVKDGKLSLVIQLNFNNRNDIHKNWNEAIPRGLFDPITSDLSIVVNSVRIPCHKLILSLASPVISAMFENQMQESFTNEILIPDFSEEVVRSFLKCIYDPITLATEMDSSFFFAQELLLIANKYQVNHITSSATNHFIRNINESNVLDILLFADQCQQLVIRKEALVFMARHSKVFLKSSEMLRRFTVDLLSEFLSMVADLQK